MWLRTELTLPSGVRPVERGFALASDVCRIYAVDFYAMRLNDPSLFIFGETAMPDAVGVICNAGVCTEVDPVTAIVLIALDQLIKELNSKEPLGPNGEIIKALQTAWNDIANGPGDRNDIVRALRTAWDDLSNGMIPNNEIRKVFESLGVKF